MNIHQATENAAQGVRDLKDDVLQSAEDAVQSTQNTANATLDRAREGVERLRTQADPAIDELAAKAQDLASRGIEYCAAASARARQQVHEAAEATSRYVAQQPGRSLVMAAATGAALATLCFWMSSHRRHSGASHHHSMR